MINSNVSAALILDKRSTKKDGTSPVKVRIIFNRTNKKLYSIGHDATDDDWERITKTTPRERRLVDEKKAIYAFLAKAEAIIADLHNFNFVDFELQWFGTIKDKKSFADTITVLVDRLKEEGRVTTATSYKALGSSIGKFKSNIAFDEITHDFLTKYEAHLRREKKAEASIGIYMRTLRAVCKWAIKQKIMLSKQYLQIKN